MVAEKYAFLPASAGMTCSHLLQSLPHRSLAPAEPLGWAGARKRPAKRPAYERRASSSSSSCPMTMLRVQRRRRPEDWEKRQESLSGRFLPLDPGDEALLDELERSSSDLGEGGIIFGPDGPPVAAYGAPPGPTWSRRADAAKKRWADPSYRANMLAKRAEKKLHDIEAGLVPDSDAKRKVHIGRLDSITLSSEEKAKAINKYARSNKKRSEKISAYHRDRAAWMANRLSTGEELRQQRVQEDYKRERQLQRQAVARKRHAKKLQGNEVLGDADPENLVSRP